MKAINALGLLVSVSLSHFALSSEKPLYPKQSECAFHVFEHKETKYPFQMNLDDAGNAKIIMDGNFYEGKFRASVIQEYTRLKGFTEIDMVVTGEHGKMKLHLINDWLQHPHGYGDWIIGDKSELIFIDCVSKEAPVFSDEDSN